MKINNKIKERYCSLEVSKLLREKGFNCECNSRYELALKSRKDKEHGYSGAFGWKKGELNIHSGFNTNRTLDEWFDGVNWYGCSRPTHAIAIEWIKQNLGLYIWAEPCFKSSKWKVAVSDLTLKLFFYSKIFTSDEDGIDKAILFTLKNTKA